MFFFSSFNDKSKSCDLVAKIMQSAYSCVIFHVKYIKITFHAGAHPDGHQHGGRKTTETYVTELVFFR